MTDQPRDIPTWGFGEVLALSLPASMSMLSYTVTQFVHAAMVARLGPSVFAGQSVGALVAFIPNSFAMGTLGVVTTYVSQNFGAGKSRRCGQYAWAGLALVVLYALLICPWAGAAGKIFAWIGHAPAVQPSETLYFRYMILAIPVALSGHVLQKFFYGIHKPAVVFVAAVIANALNVLGNYALIFGRFGMPAMGLEGAAIATVFCWGLQCVILFAAFLMPGIHNRFGTRYAGGFGLRQCRDILRIGWPAGVSFLIDIFAWSIFTVFLIGRFGTEHLAGANAAVRYMHVSFLPAVGVSIAATSLVGRYIGRRQPDVARKRAHTAMLVAMAYMGVCALAFLVFRHPMIRLFVAVSPDMASKGMQAEQIVTIGGRIMICAAVFQLFDAAGIVFNGALRGAGDTRWPMIAAVALSLSVLVGGGWCMVKFLPQLTSLGPYIAATVYIIILGSAMAWRFESGHWRRIDLLGDRRADR